MPDTSHNIRQLPIYRDAFTAGVDVGLAYALTALTTERRRQHQLGANTDSGSLTAACITYADGALLAVTKVVAADSDSDPRLARMRTVHLSDWGERFCLLHHQRPGPMSQP
jgi:hypothetical protein